MCCFQNLSFQKIMFGADLGGLSPLSVLNISNMKLDMEPTISLD